MKLSFSIENWFAISSGLLNQAQWLAWSNKQNHDWHLPLPKLTKLPLLQARRMSIPSRLAVEVGLELIKETQVDFAIFISRHGELERTYKILDTLNHNQDISPTDFALSVHNTAAGLLTIIAKQAIPISSISAGQDGFHQGLIEAISLIKQGFKRILLIDFDGAIPDCYHSQITVTVPAYATGFIISQGNTCEAEALVNLANEVVPYQAAYPQSLAFLHGYLNKQPSFYLQGNKQHWLWTIN